MAQSKVSQMTESIDWVYKGDARKYGEVDVDKIAASGQSCGGLGAYAKTTTNHANPRADIPQVTTSHGSS